VAGSAAGFAVAISDPTLIAASADGTPGNNGNLQALLAVRDQPTINGQKPVDFYSSLVYQIGSEVSNSSADLDASKLVLQQLNDQRSAISGVNLDEEATHLVEYQRAYDAAARAVSVINQLLGDVVNLGTQTTF
jgi:flagellar hook-associated protein 1 FlgK